MRRRIVALPGASRRPQPGADAPAARRGQRLGADYEGDGAGWAVAAGGDGAVCALTTWGAECCQPLVGRQRMTEKTGDRGLLFPRTLVSISIIGSFHETAKVVNSLRISTAGITLKA
jgi:hypothetical protein